MSDYEFELPWPPTTNHWLKPIRMGKSLRMMKSKDGKEYAKLVLMTMHNAGLSGEKLTGRLYVKITLNPPTLRKYDVDNRTKAIFDSLSECDFWEDDEQVDRLTIIKGEKIKGGNVLVKITKLD